MTTETRRMSDILQLLEALYHQAHSYKSEVEHFGKPVSDVVERLGVTLTRAAEIVISLGGDCPKCNSANTKWLNPNAGTGPVYFKCLDCGEEWSESDSDRAEEG